MELDGGIDKEDEMKKIKTLEEKKKVNIIVRILIGVGAVMAIMGLLFVGFVIYFFTGGPAKVTKGADKYNETMHKYTQEVVGKVHTGFFSFPEAIPESAFEAEEEPTFYFSYQDTWDDPTCEVYLKCKYSDEDYKAELERLKNDVFKLDNGEKKAESSLEYEESDRFVHPVYKAIDCDNHSYEYAMDLGNNEIAYIYVSFKTSPASIKAIPKDYLPSNYTESINKSTYGNGGHNVYVVEKTNEFTSYDYGERY